MSTPFTSGARPHWCGHYIEQHNFVGGQFVCPNADTFDDLEARTA